MPKNQINSQIPSSYDQEYFGDGEVYRVNKSRLRNTICEKCEWKLDAKKREVNCKVCGRGFKFLPHHVTEYGDRLEIQTLSKKITIPLSEI